MSESSEKSAQQTYVPPTVWQWNTPAESQWSSTNRPTAGATHEQSLPKGDHALQLYSMATPNGQKVTIMLEELLEAGVTAAEYDAYLINITQADQFGSEFVQANPNSKIPALLDSSNGEPVRVFESGAIVLYLAEKFGHFLPEDIAQRTEVLNWLFWLQGSAPYVGGGFGHFYHYAPEKIEYAIDRFTMETKRLMDVLDKQLANNSYIAGDEYTIADIVIWPWFGNLVRGLQYDAGEFLEASSYKHLLAWAEKISERPAVERGRKVNRFWGEPEEQVVERHSAADFE
jgi:GST-like protein